MIHMPGIIREASSSEYCILMPVLRERARGDASSVTLPAPRKNMSKAERAANQRLTKRVLEDQMRQKMMALWRDVQEAERGTENGDVGALDKFIYSAGTMVENHRMAARMFNKNRVSLLASRCRRRGRSDLPRCS